MIFPPLWCLRLMQTDLELGRRSGVTLNKPQKRAEYLDNLTRILLKAYPRNIVKRVSEGRNDSTDPEDMPMWQKLSTPYSKDSDPRVRLSLVLSSLSPLFPPPYGMPLIPQRYAMSPYSLLSETKAEYLVYSSVSINLQPKRSKFRSSVR